VLNDINFNKALRATYTRGARLKFGEENDFMDITTGIFGLFVLACAYSAQYWAKQCRDELREIKETLKRQGR
jgi:hypothetical protein